MMKSVGIPELVSVKTACCGCGLCQFLCPQDAIDMIEDEEGFLYPKIDKQLCVGCLSCMAACMIKLRRKEVKG